MSKHELSDARAIGGRTLDPRVMRNVQRHLGRELRSFYDRLPSPPDARLCALARRLEAMAVDRKSAP